MAWRYRWYTKLKWRWWAFCMNGRIKHSKLADEIRKKCKTREDLRKAQEYAAKKEWYKTAAYLKYYEEFKFKEHERISE